MACSAAGVGRATAYEHKAADPEFAAAWEDAIEEAVEALETEARRRAIEGVEQPIVSGGEIIATVQRYSDTLTIFLLKAHRPERYRDNVRLEHTGPAGVAPVMIYVPDNGRMGAPVAAPLRPVTAPSTAPPPATEQPAPIPADQPAPARRRVRRPRD